MASLAGMVRSDADGVVALDDGPADDGALEQYHVVAAGFWPRRDAVAVDGVITLRPLEVRAVYLPYERLWDSESLDWALGLARSGLISAIVIDIKEEGGGVLPLAATAAVRSIDAVVDPGADMAAFLDELAWLGVYRIARQVVFLDTRLGRSDLETALLTPDGRQLRDDMGLGWTTPFSAKARRYNIDIALQAARHFDEIQFDYIRFPAGPFQVHAETTGEQRSAAVARFAREAGHALHAVGAAVSIDTFGETTVIRAEDAVGQVLEDLIPTSTTTRRCSTPAPGRRGRSAWSIRRRTRGGSWRSRCAPPWSGCASRAWRGCWCAPGCRTIATISRAGCTTATRT